MVCVLSQIAAVNPLLSSVLKVGHLGMTLPSVQIEGSGYSGCWRVQWQPEDFGSLTDAFVYRDTRMGRHATGIDITGSKHLESR